MPDLAEVGDFCPNDACPDAGKADGSNIVKYGTTAKGLQRYRCKTCGKTFSENTGTVFYNKHTPAEEITETLALVAEGVRVASPPRVKGYKEGTIRNWLRQAAEHAKRVEGVLMEEYEIMADTLNEPFPARAAVQVSALPKGVDVEMEGVAVFDD